MDRAASPDPGRRTRLVIAAVLTAVAIVAVSLVVGRMSASTQANPSTTSAEAGFARDMQVHHQQAVEMALIVRDRTDDAAVRLLAYDIATAQSQQAGQMFAWLNVWGVPQAASEPSMTWMTRPPLGSTEHDHAESGEATDHVPGGPMPGMATAEQLEQLAAASGVEAERMFLTLMIAHHKGGVEMAQALLDRSDYRVTADFARAVIYAQTSEIQMMEDMLKKRS